MFAANSRRRRQVRTRYTRQCGAIVCQRQTESNFLPLKKINVVTEAITLHGCWETERRRRSRSEAGPDYRERNLEAQSNVLSANAFIKFFAELSFTKATVISLPKVKPLAKHFGHNTTSEHFG